MALPTVLLFHNSRPMYKYNYTQYSLDKFAEFVTILTGIEPLQNVTLEPREEDFIGKAENGTLVRITELTIV